MKHEAKFLSAALLIWRDVVGEVGVTCSPFKTLPLPLPQAVKLDAHSYSTVAYHYFFTAVVKSSKSTGKTWSDIQFTKLFMTDDGVKTALATAKHLNIMC